MLSVFDGTLLLPIMNESIDKLFTTHLLSLERGHAKDAFVSANWCNLVLERSYYGVSQPHDAELNRWVKHNIGKMIDVFEKSARPGVRALGMKYGGLYGRIAVPELLTEIEKTENAAIFLGCLEGLEGRYLSHVLDFIERSLARKLSMEIDVLSMIGATHLSSGLLAKVLPRVASNVGCLPPGNGWVAPIELSGCC